MENYLTIQKLRNVDKMDYEIYVDENIIGMNILASYYNLLLKMPYITV